MFTQWAQASRNYTLIKRSQDVFTSSFLANDTMAYGNGDLDHNQFRQWFQVIKMASAKWWLSCVGLNVLNTFHILIYLHLCWSCFDCSLLYGHMASVDKLKMWRIILPQPSVCNEHIWILIYSWYMCLWTILTLIHWCRKIDCDCYSHKYVLVFVLLLSYGSFWLTNFFVQNTSVA